MRFTDRVLQRWRIAKVRPFIPPGAVILDIGSADGSLFHSLGSALGKGSMGVDPTLPKPLTVNGCALVPGFFPEAIPPSAGQFDVITMLAVLEYFPPSAHAGLSEGCRRFLRPGGKLVITVPSPAVDWILAALKFLRLVDGMSLEEHYGYRVEQTTEVFPAPHFKLLRRAKFQLGLNNLFVLERTLVP